MPGKKTRAVKVKVRKGARKTGVNSTKSKSKKIPWTMQSPLTMMGKWYGR